MAKIFKRVFSFSLALVMALGLCAGALAYDDGYDYDYDAWEANYNAWEAEFLAANPDYLDELLAIDPPYWEDWGYADQEEFMYDFGIETQEEYERWLLDIYLSDEYYKYKSEKEMREYRTARGGPAEGVGVMWMGEYVSFPDAQPEITDGHTMIPVRAFVELVGGEAEFEKDGGVVVIALPDGRDVRFNVGGRTVSVLSDGEEEIIGGDVASYISSGRTYVPLRFFSGVLGYDVSWDSKYKTAVITDRAQVVAEIDANFTIINGVIESFLPDMEKTHKTEGSINADITMYDSIDGDRDFNANVSYTMLSKGFSQDFSSEFDLSALLELLPEYVFDDMDVEEMKMIKSALKSGFELIMDAESGMMYIKSPLLGIFTGADSDDAWTSTEYYPEDFADFAAEKLSIGAFIYASNLGDWYGVHSYEWMMSDAEEAAAVIGDARFKKSGDDYVLKITSEDEESEDYDDWGYYGVDSYSAEFRVKKDGSVTFDISLSAQGDYYFPVILLEASLSANPEKMNATVEVHVKNMVKVTVSADTVVTETDAKPRSAPPEGAKTA